MTTSRPAWGIVISDALKRSRLSRRAASKLAGISDTRWGQIVAGYENKGGHRIEVHGPAETVARMAMAVDVTPAAMENAGRPDVAEAMRERVSNPRTYERKGFDGSIQQRPLPPGVFNPVTFVLPPGSEILHEDQRAAVVATIRAFVRSNRANATTPATEDEWFVDMLSSVSERVEEAIDRGYSFTSPEDYLARLDRSIMRNPEIAPQHAERVAEVRALILELGRVVEEKEMDKDLFALAASEGRRQPNEAPDLDTAGEESQDPDDH